MASTPPDLWAYDTQIRNPLYPRLTYCDITEPKRRDVELREALDQQQATAEVLQVINISLGDLAPIFDTILERAMRRCEADFGKFSTYDGGRLHTPAIRGATEAYRSFLESHPLYPSPNNMHGRMLAGEPFVQISDAAALTHGRAAHPMVCAFVDLGQGRTVLAVALHKDGQFLGEIAIYRRVVRPFSDQQIGPLQNFAEQAVIAMENARLLMELRESLKQQQAIAEILQVINASPGELQPVFNILLEKAMRLCGAEFGVVAVVERGKTD